MCTTGPLPIAAFGNPRASYHTTLFQSWRRRTRRPKRRARSAETKHAKKAERYSEEMTSVSLWLSYVHHGSRPAAGLGQVAAAISGKKRHLNAHMEITPPACTFALFLGLGLGLGGPGSCSVDSCKLLESTGKALPPDRCNCTCTAVQHDQLRPPIRRVSAVQETLAALCYDGRITALVTFLASNHAVLRDSATTQQLAAP